MGCEQAVVNFCRRAVDEQAASVVDGVNAGADAVKGGIDSASSAAQRAAYDFEKRANASADRLESTVNQAGGELFLTVIVQT